MLNTGLALQQPAESTYGAFRRFLISNSGICLSDIINELRILEDQDDSHQAGHHALLAQRYEQHYCQANKIAYVPPEHIPVTLEIRNCPACAAIGYHSAIFQWEWITQCPVHRLPLTTRCSDCKQLWPTLPQITRRDCPSCGWPVRLDRERLASLPTASYKVLQHLKRMVSLYSQQAKVCLTPRLSFRYTLNEHPCIPITHPLFASTCCALFPKERHLLANWAIPLQKTVKIPFPSRVTEAESHRLCDRAFLIEQDKRIQEKVMTRVLRSIADHRHQPLVIPVQFSIELEGINENTDCYLYAYICWKALIKSLPGAGQHDRYWSRYFEWGAESQYPLIPIPMHYWHRPIDNTDYTIEHSLPPKNLLPLNLRNLLYEVDLWYCFKSILKYFDVLKASHQALKQFNVYAELPAWARPGEHYTDAVSVFLSDPDTLELVAPRSILSTSLEDLKLHE